LASDPLIVLVHLSDFHLGCDPVEDIGRDDLQPSVKRWWRLAKKADVEPQKHDLEIIKNLSYCLRTTIRLFITDRALPPDIPVAYIVSGDILTSSAARADINAFHFPFLVSDHMFPNPTTGRPICRGINLGLDRLVFVPGNHERYLHYSLDEFVNSEFGQARKHVYAERRKFDYLYWIENPTRPLFFLCMDTGQPPPRVGIAGQGRVTAEQEDWLSECADGIMTKGLNIDGQYFSTAMLGNAYKVLVAHHCVAPSEKLFLRDRATRDGLRLLNRSAVDPFLKIFDLVVFGHVHESHGYVDPAGRPVYASAGTISEYWSVPNRNSFNIYCIHADKTMTGREYIWNDFRFARGRVLVPANGW